MFYCKVLLGLLFCEVLFAQEQPITNELVTGQVNYAELPFFKILPQAYATRQIYLHEQAANQFVAMCKAAEQQGIRFVAVSGARNFAYQKNIWERKWKNTQKKLPLERAKSILEYSAMPLASRHHWGTEVDINSVSPAYFLTSKGKKEYQWLKKNASKFGFCQVYNDEATRKGYKEDKWHWSYMPIAQKYLSYYLENINYEHFKNFLGSEQAKELQIIEHYVKGIAMGCTESFNSQ